DFGRKSSSVGFHNTLSPYGSAKRVSSNSVCMSMMCVTPSPTTSIMLASFQMPPPTAIWSVTQVMSMPAGAPVTLVFEPYSSFYRHENQCGTSTVHLKSGEGLRVWPLNCASGNPVQKRDDSTVPILRTPSMAHAHFSIVIFNVAHYGLF